MTTRAGRALAQGAKAACAEGRERCSTELSLDRPVTQSRGGFICSLDFRL